MTSNRKTYGRDWEELERRFLRAHPICAVVGCGQRATQVDHIEMARFVPHRRLDWTNLQALCHSHHAVLTRVYDDGWLDGACDAEGQPIDPNHPWNLKTTAEGIEVSNTRKRADPKVRAKLKRAYVTGGGR